MKRLLIFLILIFCGCAAIRQAKVDYAACWADPVCRADAAARAEELSSKAAAVSVLSPVPGTAAVVKPLVAGFGLLTFLILGGQALRKKAEPTPS